jgi:hypothetical protein
MAKRTFCADAAVHPSSRYFHAVEPSVVLQVIDLQDESSYVSNLVYLRSGEPLVLAAEEPSLHTQARTVLHMRVKHSRVRRMRRPYGAMPSRTMRTQIRLVLGPTPIYAVVRLRDFLIEPFDLLPVPVSSLFPSGFPPGQ